MYKMVVSDFYGSLINSEEAISLSTMLEIDRIRKNKVLFTITTNRSARIVIDYNRDFPFIDYVVAFNGSYIYDLRKNKVLFNKTLCCNAVKKICKLFKDKDMCLYTLDNCNYTGKYKDEDFSEIIIDLDDFLEEERKNLYKIKVFFDNLKDCKEANKLLKDEKKIVTYINEEDNYYVLEVYSSLESKLSGVEKICKKNNIKLKEVLAICSSISSIDLVKKVGNGCCVSNCVEKLKRYADFESCSNEEKGVEQVLKKYLGDV